MREGADELVDHFVQAARAAGCSWADIGRTLGVTKRAAQQLFVTVAAALELLGLDAGRAPRSGAPPARRAHSVQIVELVAVENDTVQQPRRSPFPLLLGHASIVA